MRIRIARTLSLNLVIVMTLACAALYGMTTAADRSSARPAAADSPAALAAAHGCWSGDAPADMAGRMPGHAVVTVREEPRYAGPRMVRRALEQIFEGVDHGLTVHAFCR